MLFCSCLVDSHIQLPGTCYPNLTHIRVMTHPLLGWNFVCQHGVLSFNTARVPQVTMNQGFRLSHMHQDYVLRKRNSRQAVPATRALEPGPEPHVVPNHPFLNPCVARNVSTPTRRAICPAPSSLCVLDSTDTLGLNLTGQTDIQTGRRRMTSLLENNPLDTKVSLACHFSTLTKNPQLLSIP